MVLGVKLGFQLVQLKHDFLDVDVSTEWDALLSSGWTYQCQKN